MASSSGSSNKQTATVTSSSSSSNSNCDKLNIYNTLSKEEDDDGSTTTNSKMTDSNIYAGGTQTSLSLSVNQPTTTLAAKTEESNLADASKSSTGGGASSQAGRDAGGKSSSVVQINNLSTSASASGSSSSGQPMTTTATTSLSAATTTNASGGGDSIMPQKSRKKVSLGKGYSLMDWIRVTRENPNIAGNYGVMRKITPEEMALHNKEDDCWMALFGKVYNVTPYMKFHPGGIDELMRGAGANSTDLFNEIHPWVNLQGMLEKCIIGTLVTNEPPAEASPAKDAKQTTKTTTLGIKAPAMLAPLAVSKPNQVALAASEPEPLTVVNSVSNNKPEIRLIKVSSKDGGLEIPVLDSYQTNEYVNVVIYTKWKKMKLDNVIIDKMAASGQATFTLVIYIYAQLCTYRYSIDIPAPIKDDYDLKLSKDGKIELIIFKVEKIHWWQMCPKLNFLADIVQDSNRGVNFRECTISKRVKVTHDTDLYYLDLPVSTRMSVPLGYHVFLRLPNDDISIKPYTVVDDSLLVADKKLPNRAGASDGKLCRSASSNFGKQVCLMIKHYADGYLTSRLKRLEIGSKLEVSNFTGNFELERLEDCDELILICAGTGFTPMIRLINYLIESNSTSKIQLLFFNKTSKDILMREQHNELTRLHPKRFEVVNILSQPEPEWKGRQGRISAELISDLVMTKTLSKPLFCVCGPKPFTELANSILLLKFKFPSDSVHLFLS